MHSKLLFTLSQVDLLLFSLYYVQVSCTGIMNEITTSYTHARQNLASLLDKVEMTDAIAVITRKGHKDIALLPADELSSILETLHLLRSPKNAQRLFEAIAESEARNKNEIRGETLEDLIEQSQNNL